MRQILGQSEAELAGWREALREALGPNGQLMVNLVPELELVIGEQPPVPELAAAGRAEPLPAGVPALPGRVRAAEHPLALFLDDLQWLDAATLELLEHLVTHPEVRHLLLIGAYRDNEVGPAHPLTADAGGDPRGRRAACRRSCWRPLEPDDVGRLVADALHCEPDATSRWRSWCYEKTGGNPFFAIQFLTALADEGLLAFDPVAAAWTWDIERIRAKGYTDNVVDLMVGKLNPPARPRRRKLQAAGLPWQRRRDRHC